MLVTWLFLLSFNSIKVRLNPFLICCCSQHIRFQFHKGTIKPTWPRSVCMSGTLFQFHKGTIKPYLSTKNLLIYGGFNSIKVRLNPDQPQGSIPRPAFQFHKGTIKPDVGRLFSKKHLSFNSIKVRLNLLAPLTLAIFHFSFNSIRVRLNLPPRRWRVRCNWVSIP